MLIRRYTVDDEKFFREVVFPEEDRYLFTTAPWRGEFRWFRAPNVVPLEYFRRQEREDQPVAA
jgi:hypothetical protein